MSRSRFLPEFPCGTDLYGLIFFKCAAWQGGLAPTFFLLDLEAIGIDDAIGMAGAWAVEVGPSVLVKEEEVSKFLLV